MSEERFDKEYLNVTNIPSESILRIKCADTLGLFVYLCSTPSDCKITRKSIMNHFSIGKTKTNKLLNNLRELGFLDGHNI